VLLVAKAADIWRLRRRPTPAVSPGPGGPSPSRRRSSTGLSSSAPIASQAGASRNATRGPSSGAPNRLKASITSPPTNAAATPLVAVAMFEMPMYRPADALGMMSVRSAQSTARKLPPPMPTKIAPIARTGGAGASAAIVMPSALVAVAA
jgi:hypothetical protein